jgi:hypothetical protein
MLELPPRKTRLHKQPGTIGAKALELQPWPHRVDGRIGLRRADTSGPFILQVPDLPVDALAPGTRPHPSRLQLPWYRLPIPEP